MPFSAEMLAAQRRVNATNEQKRREEAQKRREEAQKKDRSLSLESYKNLKSEQKWSVLSDCVFKNINPLFPYEIDLSSQVADQICANHNEYEVLWMLPPQSNDEAFLKVYAKKISKYFQTQTNSAKANWQLLNDKILETQPHWQVPQEN
jgi:hypothetical protein